MQIALSTSYFAGRQDDPAVLCARIRALGFDAVEMGYYIPVERVPDWKSALAAEGLPVGSVHAFCPMEARFLRYGPEAWSIADPDDGARRTACMRLMQTLEATVGFGARAVVLHGGRVRMTERGLLFGSRPYRSKLSEAYRAHPGRIDEDLVRHEQELRSEGVPPLMDAVCRSLETVLPVFEEAGVALCFENLPGFEAFPDPAETAWLADRFRSEGKTVMMGGIAVMLHAEEAAEHADCVSATGPSTRRWSRPGSSPAALTSMTSAVSRRITALRARGRSISMP